MQNSRNIAIIGGGIAGLCTAVYAQRSGYRATVFEMNEGAGGLATNWRRGCYTFETCLHWLLGSNPESAMYSHWREVFDIDRLAWVNPVEYARIESERGERLIIYTNPDKLEAELTERAPEDAKEIRRFTSAIRKLAEFEVPDFAEHGPRHWWALLQSLPELPTFRWWSNLSIREYGQRFKHPVLRAFFSGGSASDLSAIALVLSLAWMSKRNAGYPIGGSQAVIRLIVDRLLQLGGDLRLGSKVSKIWVENNTAKGIELTNGTVFAADWVISAADGHTTIFDMLGGCYVNESIENVYDKAVTFPSYLQVSLGIARDLSDQAPFIIRVLDDPLKLDPVTELSQISFRIFNYDPTFAPAGKTAVTCFLPTRNHAYWTSLQGENPERYQAEKQRVAEEVVRILEQFIPEVRDSIEVQDVSTPATVIRYTGNWKGSMEGWMLRPGESYRPLSMSLPDLERFQMVGQWVLPGGGLPSGLITARTAIESICKHDHTSFREKAYVA